MHDNDVKIPPHDEATETAILGAAIIMPAIAHRMLAGTAEHDFYSLGNRLIYRAIGRDMAESAGESDAVSIAAAFVDVGVAPNHGDAMILADTLMRAGSNAVFIDRHLARLKELRAARNVIEMGNDLAERGYDGARGVRETIEHGASALATIAASVAPGGALSLAEALAEPMAEIQRGTTTVGRSTGLPALDDLLEGGLHPGRVYVLAARPGQGKSALALNVALAFAQRMEHVAFFSLEMLARDVAVRALSILSRLPAGRIRARHGEDQPDVLEALVAIDRIGSALTLYDRRVLTVGEIKAQCLRQHPRPRLVVIDYLQLLSAPEAQTREQAVAAVSRSLGELAGELEVPVLVPCQLNRALELRGQSEPKLSDLRESGAIENDAHAVLFLVHGEQSDDDLTWRSRVHVAKNRSGPRGYAPVAWFRDRYRFQEGT